MMCYKFTSPQTLISADTDDLAEAINVLTNYRRRNNRFVHLIVTSLLIRGVVIIRAFLCSAKPESKFETFREHNRIFSQSGTMPSGSAVVRAHF